MKAANDYDAVCGVRKFCQWVLSGLIIATLGATSHAAIFSWSGGGTDGNWSDSANWGFAGTPTNGDTIIFSPSQPHLLNTNDITGLTLNEVRFVGAGGGYDIFGNSFTLTNSIQATNTAGGNTINNEIDFATADIDITVSNLLTLAGALNGSTGFSKNGSGTLTLSGTLGNGYNGTTHVNDGSLALSKTGTYGIGNGTLTVGDGIGSLGSALVEEFGSYEILDVSVVVYGDGEVEMNGNSDAFGTLVSVNDGGRILNSGSGVLSLLNGTVVQSDSTNGAESFITSSMNIGTTTCTFTQTASGVLFMGGNISGSASFIESGVGQLLLAASNSFTGPVTINGGALIIFDSWALGATNSGTTVNDPGTLAIDGSLNIVGEPLTLNATSGYEGFGAVYVYGGGSNVWGGPVTLDVNAQINVASPLVLNITGSIGGAGGVVVPGAGTLIYGGSATNTYAGLTTVNNGVLSLNRTAYANAAIQGNVVVNNTGILRLANSEQIANVANVTVNSGGLFDFNTNYEVIDTLTGSGSVTFGPDGYLEIGANNGTSTFNGLMSGIGFTNGYTVGKFGTGTFTMTANNTYQNGSDVFEGTLVVNGTQPQSPVRYMQTGTTLGGSGQVGDIVSANGTIAPGIAGLPAILTCSNIAFTTSGNFTVRLNGPNPGTGYDQLVVLGAANNLGSAALTLLPAFSQTPTINQQFTIINNQGGVPIAGTFNGLPDNSIISSGGYYFRINYNGSGGNNVVLTVLGVPGNTVTFDSVAEGWYDSTGYHSPVNANYICGGDGATTNFYRDWFVFNAPVSGSSIIGAELIVNCHNNISQQKEQTYLLRGVTTPIATLEAGGSGLIGIYDDLGSNAVYSERNVETDESGQYAIIPLNVKFFNDITAAAGGQIALGGSIVPPLSTNSYLFGGSGSGGASDVRLRLTYGNSITLNAVDTGWYDDTGAHSANNSNYFAGFNGTTYNDYFVYNLPVISGPLVSAQFLVNCYTVFNTGDSNPYQLYDVTTPITTLTNNATDAIGTFDDLGSGVSYGGRDVFDSESGLKAGIPLDSEFVSAVYAHNGGQIALGGADASTNGYLFSFSPRAGIPTDAQLWLGFLSAPATTPIFVNSTNTGSNMFQFTLSGTSGSSNEIQGSFDFTNWDYMGDLYMTNSTSVFTYTNSSLYTPGGFPYRFFRAKITP